MKWPKWRVFVDKYYPIPWGYGVGSRPYNMQGVYCYPMPFHLLVQAYRWFYGWIQIGWYPDRWEKKFWLFISDQKDIGYQAGFKAGRREGHEDGAKEIAACYRQGYKEGVEQTLRLTKGLAKNDNPD